MRHTTVAAAAALALMAAHAAHADVIYSDLAGFTIASEPSITNNPFAFIASETATLQQIDVNVVDRGGSGSFITNTISLLSGAGTVLGTWGTGSPGAYFYNSPFTETVLGISGITLTAGTTYYLELANPSFIGLDLLENAQGNADFDVIGTAATPVPEPATLALFGAALLSMGVIRRRRLLQT